MTAAPASTNPAIAPNGAGVRRRTLLWCAIAAGLLVFFAANAHLVYVAVTSQPDCVDHLRPGEHATGRFSAAKSACSP